MRLWRSRQKPLPISWMKRFGKHAQSLLRRSGGVTTHTTYSAAHVEPHSIHRDPSRPSAQCWEGWSSSWPGSDSLPGNQARDGWKSLSLSATALPAGTSLRRQGCQGCRCQILMRPNRYISNHKLLRMSGTRFCRARENIPGGLPLRPWPKEVGRWALSLPLAGLFSKCRAGRRWLARLSEDLCLPPRICNTEDLSIPGEGR
jgi:hypothetical protein